MFKKTQFHRKIPTLPQFQFQFTPNHRNHNFALHLILHDQKHDKKFKPKFHKKMKTTHMRPHQIRAPSSPLIKIMINMIKIS
jgi:hypothetical protein